MNRITAGHALVGKMTVGTSETVASANITSLAIGGTAVNATATEINNQCDLSAAGALRKWKSITIPCTGSTATDSGWALPARCAVNDVYLRLSVGTSAANAISVGLLATTSGDADGYLVAVPTSSEAGKLQGGRVVASSSGFTSSYWGILLLGGTTPVVSSSDNVQFFMKQPHILNELTSSKNIVLTCSTTANDSLSGSVIIDYTEFA
jgi:hypothetical protein